MSVAAAALPNESALVSRAAVEPAAFAAICDHYFRRVYSYVRYRVVDAKTADDLTAEVFERVVVNLERYRPTSPPIRHRLSGVLRILFSAKKV